MQKTSQRLKINSNFACLVILTNSFFIRYLADPQQTLGHYWGDCFAHPILITAFNLYLTIKSPDASYRGWVYKPSRAPSGFEPWTIRLIRNSLTQYATLPTLSFNFAWQLLLAFINKENSKRFSIFDHSTWKTDPATVSRLRPSF